MQSVTIPKMEIYYWEIHLSMLGSISVFTKIVIISQEEDKH